MPLNQMQWVLQTCSRLTSCARVVPYPISTDGDERRLCQP
jgi:hypothetical protein